MQQYTPVSHSTQNLDNTPMWLLNTEHKYSDTSKQITERVRPEWNSICKLKTGDFHISGPSITDIFLDLMMEEKQQQK